MTVNWFRAVRWANAVSNPYVSSQENCFGIEEDELRTGKEITSWSANAWIRCTKPEWDGEPDDVLQTHLDVPIYSRRLQEMIAGRAFSGIQFLPIHVLRRDGTEIPGFAIANILNILPVMNLERSELDRYEDDWPFPPDRGQIAGVYKLALRGAGLESYDIIRVKEFDLAECVSQRFKDAFEEGLFSGCSFKELEVI